MDNIVPKLLIELLGISMVFSIILMAVIQKIKSFPFINKSSHVLFINLVLAFAIGIPFSINFYNINWIDGIWIGLFSFVGASSIYQALKSQNLINYTPVSVEDSINISKDKEIKRNDISR